LENLNKQENIKSYAILVGVFILSLISVFGIYNTFSDLNLYKMILHIQNTSDKIANAVIALIFTATMLILQGVNFKKKELSAKIKILSLLALFILSIIAIVFMFTTTIVYPLITMLIVGISLYLFDMVFSTLGLKGFFFFILIFGLILIAMAKAHLSSTFLISIGELFLSFILFISATYPRLKAIVFKISIRDNIDISNTGGEDTIE